MDLTDVPAAPIIEEHGVEFSLAPDQRVTDVVVLAKTLSMDDGTVGLIIASSSAMRSDWILKRGIVAAALEILAGTPLSDIGDDDYE